MSLHRGQQEFNDLLNDTSVKPTGEHSYRQGHSLMLPTYLLCSGSAKYTSNRDTDERMMGKRAVFPILLEFLMISTEHMAFQ